MRVLVACEFSGVVREAFKAKGHDAWSCKGASLDTTKAKRCSRDRCRTFQGIADAMAEQWG